MRGPEELMTGFERDPDRADDVGAPLEDVAQEAVDATAAAYTNDATIDVEERLGVELRSRGVRADADARRGRGRDPLRPPRAPRAIGRVDRLTRMPGSGCGHCRPRPSQTTEDA